MISSMLILAGALLIGGASVPPPSCVEAFGARPPAGALPFCECVQLDLGSPDWCAGRHLAIAGSALLAAYARTASGVLAGAGTSGGSCEAARGAWFGHALSSAWRDRDCNAFLQCLSADAVTFCPSAASCSGGWTEEVTSPATCFSFVEGRPASGRWTGTAAAR